MGKKGESLARMSLVQNDPMSVGVGKESVTAMEFRSLYERTQGVLQERLLLFEFLIQISICKLSFH